jgi:hypothetical protein
MARTPISQDKRFMVVVGACTLVCVGAWLGKHLNEQELTFIGVTLSAFIAQSQWGQTRRHEATETARAPGAGAP